MSEPALAAEPHAADLVVEAVEAVVNAPTAAEKAALVRAQPDLLLGEASPSGPARPTCGLDGRCACRR
jgi:hypothetical protein